MYTRTYGGQEGEEVVAKKEKLEKMNKICKMNANW
jgi:hypothetical protein